LDTAQQIGRFSVSTAADISYKEMASHCEALLMGKQQKMSRLMTKPENEPNRTAPQSKVQHNSSLDAVVNAPSYLLAFPFLTRLFEKIIITIVIVMMMML